MRAVLEQAQRNFTYVLLDLPPLGLFVDARAMAPQVDAFILVVEWGQSARKLVQDMLATERMVREKCLGVVLNKTDFEKLRLYEDYGSREYYLHKYAKSRSGRAGS
jgi:succinoglycan biosynthesis transport protein ExoP